jgi:hypothetical protein
MPRDLLGRALGASPAGQGMGEAEVDSDVLGGFEANPDGTIDLVAYVAWLLKEHGYGRQR